MKKHIVTACLYTIITAVVLGVLYPLAITGVARLAFRDKADGQLLVRNGRIVGSRLIGQPFTGEGYFHSRPSTAGTGYDASSSAGSNLGPTNKTLIARVDAAVKTEATGAPVPIDLVTSSGSGLDPDITPAAALYQAPRIARERGMTEGAVRTLVMQHVTPPLIRGLRVGGETRAFQDFLHLGAACRFPFPSAGGFGEGIRHDLVEVIIFFAQRTQAQCKFVVNGNGRHAGVPFRRFFGNLLRRVSLPAFIVPSQSTPFTSETSVPWKPPGFWLGYLGWQETGGLMENCKVLRARNFLHLNVIPKTASKYGLSESAVGAHSGRTMMLSELTLLLATSEPDADYETLRSLVVADNVLLKKTSPNRVEAFRRLRSLYGLETGLVIWRTLRELWLVSDAERPLLALLCVLGRDALLRATAAAVLEQPVGSAVTPQLMEAALSEAFPGRYSRAVIASAGRNALSSWTQSGHLERRRDAGKNVKFRVAVQPGVAAGAYALLLGYLTGVQGVPLFDTVFCRALDAPPNVMDALAFSASQRGWLEYRRVGNVAEISFSRWLGRE